MRATGETKTVPVTRPRWADMADEEEAVQQKKMFGKKWSRPDVNNERGEQTFCE